MLFSWLLLGHLVGDFLFQNRWMAEGKANRWLPLLVHSLVYTATVTVCALAAGGLTWRGILIIFLAHLVLDRRVFVNWWAKNITQSQDVPWLVIMIDQSWHIVILAVATLIG
ncbi:MAG: DUF3307 domain-containing protein [Pelotomaculum sp.]|jgi:hypothetical protein